ncbi:ABC transporter permease [uncultured Desulfobacter sp.]|uniref:ABC transporter permease n=1 Tax=uncultured Desulfobacter sp. TaxID=240139 RepID=UPI002AAAB77A|nr:ABC transporter permease [uncultured Desulfobacter sp.]
MVQIAATLKKEFLLLIRDRAGLLLLFVMPALLVLIICLVQEKVLNPTTRVLIIDNDTGIIGKSIVKGLKASDNILAVNGKDIGCTDVEKAKSLVNNGKYQFSIVIPEGSTGFAFKKAEQFFMAEASSLDASRQITVYFDPSVQGGFRAAVSNAISKVLLCIEYEIKLSQAAPGPDSGQEISLPQPWFDIKEVWATQFGFVKMPTSVQQNVPAWALFGIFFICVPLSSSLIQERENKTLDRLRSMPVSRLTLVAGKIIAYIGVCLCQFLLVFLIGKYLFPLIGLPAFVLGEEIGAVLVILTACAVAAANYGIMLGALAGSHEQALVIGPASIVIAAALGGIIVPVYLMPEPMQLISRLSPLAWALDGFYDILLRGRKISAVLPRAGCLIAFAAAAFAISHMSLSYKRRG